MGHRTINKLIITILIIASLAIIKGCYYDHEETLYPNDLIGCDTLDVKYSLSIAPILTQNCTVCHSAAFPSGGIALDDYNSVKAVVDNGKFWGTINQISGFSPMPKGGNKLNSCYRKKILIWIDGGALNN